MISFISSSSVPNAQYTHCGPATNWIIRWSAHRPAYLGQLVCNVHNYVHYTPIIESAFLILGEKCVRDKHVSVPAFNISASIMIPGYYILEHVFVGIFHYYIIVVLHILLITMNVAPVSM